MLSSAYMFPSSFLSSIRSDPTQRAAAPTPAPTQRGILSELSHRPLFFSTGNVFEVMQEDLNPSQLSSIIDLISSVEDL